MICYNCPRHCDLEKGRFCGTDKLKVAKVMPHYFEEPCISGTKGSGAIFFSGCNLRCCFCQNYVISHECKGEYYSVERLAETMLSLASSGVHNINLVTAAHVKTEVAEALGSIKSALKIPVVYNSSGYEGDLSVFDGLVDVYLPDFKYFDSRLAARYSGAKDYPEVAMRTIDAMMDMVGAPVIKDGLITRGTIIRHLVLPGHREDSMRIMDVIAKRYPSAYVSIMRQYTPEFNRGPASLSRRVTSFEYNSVVDHAAELGLKGFMQDKSSATADFTPSF